MSLKIKPAKIVNGFVERFSKEKLSHKSLYEGSFEHWLKVRGIRRLSEYNGGLAKVEDIEKALATPVLDKQTDLDLEVGEIFKIALDFLKKHDCDLIIIE